MITQRLGAEEGDTPVEQQPAAMQDFDPTYDRCGSFFAIRPHAHIHFTVRIGLKAGIFQSGHYRPDLAALARWARAGSLASTARPRPSYARRLQPRARAWSRSWSRTPAGPTNRSRR